ncbi:tyrosine-type recombinase/integrase [Pimelobacter sp. 30-1]|uniref:tyrosine-type recombinase/integrase n=1 Tax=Pimelobacter sp. 30-1 TaxID=2004991 RepID=UPI00217088F3|nr:hypothetical protein [Pimelobacter sp. 30-1]
MGSLAGSASPTKSTRMPTLQYAEPAPSAAASSVRRRPGAASGSCTSPRPSCPCCSSTSSNMPRQASKGLLFPGDRTDHMSARFLMDRYRPAREKAGRPDLTIHHLRHTALTMAGQHGATAAELQARAGHASQAAMAIYQHATLDRDKELAAKIGRSYERWRDDSARETEPARHLDR